MLSDRPPSAEIDLAAAVTVRTGKPTYRLAILSETALRDSPHGPGILPSRGTR